MSFAQETVDFLASKEARVPANDARQLATDAIVDAIGCIGLGAREPLERPLRAGLFGPISAKAMTAALTDAASEDTTAERRDSLSLYLGTLAHAADFDDISHPAYCHPTAVLLPPLLIRGAVLGASGAEFIAAYIAGIEVLGQLGRRLNLDHYHRGWHATGTLGTLGATAALAMLERLPVDSAKNALGIAASMAGGLRANFGTPVKPLHAGLAGRSAILATRLAAAGFTSSASAIDGDKGFFRTFGGAPGIAESKPWADPPEILTKNGIALKAYPSCAATHAAVDATLAARTTLGAPKLLHVRQIRVGASRHALQPLIYDRPTTPLEAKFSMRHCVGAAFLDGSLTLRSFTNGSLARPELKEIMEKVVVEVDPRVAEDPEFAAIVTVALTNGAEAEHRIDIASGKPGNWPTSESLRDKFLMCAGGGQADELYHLARSLSEMPDVRALLDEIAKMIGFALGTTDSGPVEKETVHGALA